MALSDRIKEARLKRGLTQEQLANMIGVAKSTITGYEKGNRIPPAATVGDIADATNVDANFLYQDEVRNRKENNISLEELENILKPYRKLDSYGKETIRITLERETQRVKQLQEKERYIEKLKAEVAEEFIPRRIFAYYGKIAAAGTSYGFNDVIAGTKEYPLNEINESADYTIGVSGNSMEPTFYDGDVVYVKKISYRLDVGDIGIFQKDNGIYIKRVSEDGLVSDNVNYKPMVNGGDVICLGKVLGKAE